MTKGAEVHAQVTAEEAAAELVRRRRARDSLVEYARSVDIPGAPANEDPESEIFKPIESSVAAHHRVTMEAIQRTVTRKRGRLMIFEPPGAAKSTYGSVVTPAWCMQKWSNYRIILASYASDIAVRHSRKARALCRSPRSQSIWPEPPRLRRPGPDRPRPGAPGARPSKNDPPSPWGMSASRGTERPNATKTTSPSPGAPPYQRCATSPV